MFLSLFTHILFTVSCVIFTYSCFSFVVRIQVAEFSFQLDEQLSWNTHHQYKLFKLVENETAFILPNKPAQIKISVKENPTILDRFSFVNPPLPVCKDTYGTDNFMIILVLSRSVNIDYRHVIRATWGAEGVHTTTSLHIKTIFFVGIDDASRSTIQLEQKMFNDVIEIGIPETYPFVAHKELAALYWSRLHCPSARLIFRADDDIFLDTFLLANYIKESLNLAQSDGIYGWFRHNNTVHRADKWAVTKQEYPSNIYPTYTFGIGYLLSNFSCQRLIEAASHPHHQVIRIGDVYITGILREAAKVPFFEFPDMKYAYSFGNPLACDEYFQKYAALLICMSKLHIGQIGDPYEFYDVWDIINERHKLTTATVLV